MWFLLKGIDITNYIKVKHSWQEFSHFHIDIRDYVNTEFGKAFATSRSIDRKVENDSINFSWFWLLLQALNVPSCQLLKDELFCSYPKVSKGRKTKDFSLTPTESELIFLPDLKFELEVKKIVDCVWEIINW